MTREDRPTPFAMAGRGAAVAIASHAEILSRADGDPRGSIAHPLPLGPCLAPNLAELLSRRAAS